MSNQTCPNCGNVFNVDVTAACPLCKECIDCGLMIHADHGLHDEECGYK